MLIKLAKIDPELYMRITFSLMLLFLISSTVTANEQCKQLSQLEWMLGDWQTTNAKIAMKESWSKISDNSFEGQGQQLDSQGKVKSEESLRLLKMQDGVFYLAKVTQNLLPVAFQAIQCVDNKVIFENTSHDFPTRLTYQLVNKRLSVKVEGTDGKGFVLNFEKTDKT